MMHTKDYQVLEHRLKLEWPRPIPPDPSMDMGYRHAIQSICTALYLDNRRFDAARFKANCEPES